MNQTQNAVVETEKDGQIDRPSEPNSTTNTHGFLGPVLANNKGNVISQVHGWTAMFEACRAMFKACRAMLKEMILLLGIIGLVLLILLLALFADKMPPGLITVVPQLIALVWIALKQ